MPAELKSKFTNHLKQRIEKLEKEVDNPTDINVMIKAPFVLDPRKAKKIKRECTKLIFANKHLKTLA